MCAMAANYLSGYASLIFNLLADITIFVDGEKFKVNSNL